MAKGNDEPTYTDCLTLGAKISTFPECNNPYQTILNRVNRPLHGIAKNCMALSVNLQGV